MTIRRAFTVGLFLLFAGRTSTGQDLKQERRLPITAGTAASAPAAQSTAPVARASGDVPHTLSTAAALGAIGGTAIVRSESVGAPTDVDLYRFEVAAGQRVGFDIDTATNGPPGLGSYLRVFNAQGYELAANNDRAAPGDGPPGADSGGIGFDAYIEYTFASAGTYYVGVSNWQHRSYNPVNGTTALGYDTRWLTGAYSLVITVPNVDLVATSFKYSVDADSSNRASPNFPTALNGPLPVNAQFRVESVIANRGTTAAGTCSVGVYLSTDATISSTDTRIATFSLPSINPAQTVQFFGRCVLPQTNLVKKVWIGIVLDPGNQIGETNENNNANQGENIDRRTVQLYDPIERFYFYSPYSSKSAAEQDLQAAGFSVSPPGTGDGYSRHLSSSVTIRSRYDGVNYTGRAFRQHAFVFGSGGRLDYYDIDSQRWESRTFSSWTVAVQGDTYITEPSPVYAVLVAGLFPDYARYVRDWHARY